QVKQTGAGYGAAVQVERGAFYKIKSAIDGKRAVCLRERLVVAGTTKDPRGRQGRARGHVESAMVRRDAAGECKIGIRIRIEYSIVDQVGRDGAVAEGT